MNSPQFSGTYYFKLNGPMQKKLLAAPEAPMTLIKAQLATSELPVPHISIDREKGLYIIRTQNIGNMAGTFLRKDLPVLKMIAMTLDTSFWPQDQQSHIARAAVEKAKHQADRVALARGEDTRLRPTQRTFDMTY